MFKECEQTKIERSDIGDHRVQNVVPYQIQYLILTFITNASHDRSHADELHFIDNNALNLGTQLFGWDSQNRFPLKTPLSELSIIIFIIFRFGIGTSD